MLYYLMGCTMHVQLLIKLLHNLHGEKILEFESLLYMNLRKRCIKFTRKHSLTHRKH